MKNVRQIIRQLFNIVGLDIRRYHPRVTFRPELVGEDYDLNQSDLRVSFAWAPANEALDYVHKHTYTRWDLDAENFNTSKDLMEKHKWGLKGFGYSLVVETVRKMHLQWKQRLNILDVGGGGSGVCRALYEEYSDECYLVDDFGIVSGDKPTAAWYDSDWRESLAVKNPMVTYVFGRLGGDIIPELTEGSFDLIFSVSTLEHIPMSKWSDVFDHMFTLLKPNGHIVHTIDISEELFLEWQIFLVNYFKEHGVAPTVFAIKNLNEQNDNNPPLLESAEV